MMMLTPAAEAEARDEAVRRAPEYLARARAAENALAAVTALLDRTDAAAKAGQHLARLSTREIRDVIEHAAPASS